MINIGSKVAVSYLLKSSRMLLFGISNYGTFSFITQFSNFTGNW